MQPRRRSPCRSSPSGVFPEAVRTHFVAVRRLTRRIGTALPLVWGGAVIEVAGGTAGALSPAT